MFDLLLMHACGEVMRGHETRISIPGPENTPEGNTQKWPWIYIVL